MTEQHPFKWRHFQADIILRTLPFPPESLPFDPRDWWVTVSYGAGSAAGTRDWYRRALSLKHRVPVGERGYGAGGRARASAAAAQPLAATAMNWSLP